jgi:hypothetical protein
LGCCFLEVFKPTNIKVDYCPYLYKITKGDVDISGVVTSFNCRLVDRVNGFIWDYSEVLGEMNDFELIPYEEQELSTKFAYDHLPNRDRHIIELTAKCYKYEGSMFNCDFSEMTGSPMSINGIPIKEGHPAFEDAWHFAYERCWAFKSIPTSEEIKEGDDLNEFFNKYSSLPEFKTPDLI